MIGAWTIRKPAAPPAHRPDRDPRGGIRPRGGVLHARARVWLDRDVVLFATVGLTNTISLTAVFLPVVGIAAWWRLRTTETRVAIPVEQIQLLRGLSIFGLVPAPAIEAAAQRLVRLTVPQGTTVFAEGDLGDRFYIVADGSVEVRQRGAVVRTLGAGDAFGEIALLRDVARTATIVAATDADLWSLDRDGFLLAITGSPQAIAEARSRAEGMLAEDRTRG